MANTVGLELASKTDTGRIRSKNEDAVALSPAHGFAILADGMGGYSAGEVAARIATEVLQQSLEEGLSRIESQLQDLLTTRGRQIQTLMVESIRRANAAIIEAARVEPQYQGMGTTLVAAIFHGDKVSVAHVGDSRAYRFYQGELKQITRDHSLLQEQIDAGLINPEWARFAQHKNLVTRALGVDPDMEVEIHDHPTAPGEIYMLCSDGLSDMLTDDEMCETLVMCESALQAACDVLVQKANDNGGHDNISVVLARVQPGRSAHPSGLFVRLLNWLT
jgi:protein phosphatase